MGLSDEERIAKLYYGIASLIESVADSECGSDVPWDEDFNLLKERVARLWLVFLGGRSNSTYWAFGGDADAGITSASSGPWAVAVKGHLEASIAEVQRKAQEAEFPPSKAKFDPFDGFLDLPRLLRQSSPTRAAVYTAYERTEFLAYTLHRYDDDLSKRLDRLGDLIADIQGTCFTIFSKDSAFAKAYVLRRVLGLVFCNTRTGIFLDATGEKLVSAMYMHHHVTGAMSGDSSIADVVAIDKALGDAPSAVDKVVAALRLAGPNVYYDHQFESLVKAFGESARARIKPEFERCKALHDERESARSSNASISMKRDEQYVVHGFDSEEETPASVASQEAAREG